MSAGGLEPGVVFQGRYQIIRRIAGGGMGAVYECVHLQTRRKRALKVMHPQIVEDASYRARFELEARVTAEIETEHIVETFDAGIDDATGSPFLVMELLRGEGLNAVVKRRGSLGPQEVVDVLAQAARALDKTHAAGIVHRDLKPENLFLTMREDGTIRLKILDFGIAKVIAEHAKVAATGVVGTPLYMAPEQIAADGSVGPAADLYALAHIAYTLLVGEAYWVEEQKQTSGLYSFLMRVVAGPPEAPTERAMRRRQRAIPPGMDAWFLRATATLPQARFASAGEVVQTLAAALQVAPPRLIAAHEIATPSLSGAPGAATPLGSAFGLATPLPTGSLKTNGDTAGPVSHDPGPRAPAPSSKAPIALGVVALLAAMGIGGGLALLGGAPAASAPTSVPAAPSEVPAAASAPAPSASESAPAAPSASESAPAAPSASESALPAPSATATSHASAKAASKAPRAAPNCSPPFTIDAAGDKHIKPGCD